MQEYLTKEEIRQWRSSLEKITLEEYAARLGKVIQGEKHTNDMIDKVMTTSLHSMSATPDYTVHTEKLETLTLHSMFENKEAKAKNTRNPKISGVSVRWLQFGYFALEALHRNGLQISGKKYSRFF